MVVCIDFKAFVVVLPIFLWLPFITGKITVLHVNLARPNPIVQSNTNLGVAVMVFYRCN